MRLNQIITETFDNLFINDKDKRKKYADEIYNMLQLAYAGMGGLKGGGLSSPEEMIEKIPMWKIFRRGDDIKAVMLYKDKGGRKRVALATDQSLEGKKAIVRMLQDEYSQGRSYAEISGKSLAFHNKILGQDGLDQITIPPEKAAETLGISPEEIKIISDTEYQRKINGEWITKRMIGKQGNTIK